MGSRHAFTYTASSSGYLKPSSLYGGESYTTSSRNNIGTGAEYEVYRFTHEEGAVNGGTAASGTNSSTKYNSSATGSGVTNYTQQPSGSTTASNGGFGQTLSQYTGNTVITTSYSFSSGLPGGNSYSEVSGGTTTIYKSRQTKLGGESSGGTTSNIGSVLMTKTSSDKPRGYVQTLATRRTGNAGTTIVSGSGTDPDDTFLTYFTEAFSYFRSLYTSSSDQREGSGSSESVTITGTGGNTVSWGHTSANSRKYHYLSSETYEYGTSNDYGIYTTNSGTMTEFGSTSYGAEFSSSSSNSFVDPGTKSVMTLGQVTNDVSRISSVTSSDVLGTFFDEEVTYRYTETDSTEGDQAIETTFTTSAQTDIWDDDVYEYFTDKTLSAVGGRYGFVPNSKASIGNSHSIQFALSDADDSYVLDGQSYAISSQAFFSSRGTDTFQGTMMLRRTSYSSLNTVNEYITSLSSEYEYYATDYYHTGTDYDKNGFLDSTIVTYPLTTKSKSIHLEEIASSNVTASRLTNYSHTAYARPIRIVNATRSSLSTNMQTLFGENGLETFRVNYYTTTETSYEVAVNTKYGSNIDWQGVQTYTIAGQFDSFSIKSPMPTFISYESMRKAWGEKAFCSVTDTDRQSRRKAAPPKVSYSEFFLTTTVVSEIVTKYSTSIRTNESWFVPQAGESSINGSIYFPKNEELGASGQKTSIEFYSSTDGWTTVENSTDYSLSFSDDNQHTQIVQVTFSTDWSGVTRSTTSEFERFFTANDGLQTREQPMSYDYSGANYSGNTIIGGDNAYEQSGYVILPKDCHLTIVDTSGGSHLYDNTQDDNVSSRIPKGMLYVSAVSKMYRIKENEKNKYLLVTGRGPKTDDYYY
jgi:hypothetical protein